MQIGRLVSGFEFAVGAACTTVTAGGAAAGLLTEAPGVRTINRTRASAAAAIRTMAIAAADPRL